MQMAVLLKRLFEVFNGDYGNGRATRAFARSLKRRHNEEKGAEEQLPAPLGLGSRGEGRLTPPCPVLQRPGHWCQ